MELNCSCENYYNNNCFSSNNLAYNNTCYLDNNFIFKKRSFDEFSKLHKIKKEFNKINFKLVMTKDNVISVVFIGPPNYIKSEKSKVEEYYSRKNKELMNLMYK